MRFNKEWHKKEKARRSEQLGMSYSKALARLKKLLIFHLIQKCSMDHCFRCGDPIEHVDDMSTDHKQPWMHSGKANELFFDMDNIAFSHTKCNIASSRSSHHVRSNSGFKGVSRNKNRWQVTIQKNRKAVYVKLFSDPLEAAKAYDREVVKHQGSRAVTNEQLGLI